MQLKRRWPDGGTVFPYVYLLSCAFVLRGAENRPTFHHSEMILNYNEIYTSLGSRIASSCFHREIKYVIQFIKAWP